MTIKFRKLSGWLGLGALVLAIAGTAPLYAQSNDQVQSNQINSSDSKNGSTTPAEPEAAPTPAPGTYDWSGPYVGAHIGYGYGKADTTFNPQPSAATFINLAPQTLKLRPRGVNGGIQAGYNWQFGHLVVGGETDFSWSDMRRTTTVSPITQNNGTPFPGAGYLTTTQKTEWFGSLRPRLGVAFGRFLLYGTAGLAYGKVKYIANTDFRPFGTTQYPVTANKTSKGWTAGGGMEIGVNKKVSIKAEYLYYDIGRANASATAIPSLPPFSVAYSWETKASTFNAGVNFHF